MLISAVDMIAREAMLFAGVGFLVGGLDDLAVDLIYLLRGGAIRIGLIGDDRDALALAAAVPQGGRLAIFIPAWDEQAVIGAMLAHALRAIDHDDYRIYVGCYPNDLETIDAVASVTIRDPRVRLVIGAAPGPTTKAD